MFITDFTREVPKISFEVNSEKRMTDNILFVFTAGMFLGNYSATDNFVARFKKRRIAARPSIMKFSYPTRFSRTNIFIYF
jgi:hypothetical protein